MAAPAANPIAEPPLFVNSLVLPKTFYKILLSPYSSGQPIKFFNTISHPPFQKIKVTTYLLIITAMVPCKLSCPKRDWNVGLQRLSLLEFETWRLRPLSHQGWFKS